MLVLLLACTGTTTIPAETGATDDTATDTTDTDTYVPDTAPDDLDGDGANATVDCDDRDPDVFPGAEELWNDLDDDCDGQVDADGSWAGDVRISASAVYEGRRYDFSLTCPFAGTRALGTFDFTVTCTPDADDEDAQRLLGATLTVTPDDTAVTGDAWDAGAVFTSSNGWDSRGDGVVSWSDWDAARVEVSMAGVSLEASGSGSIGRE